LKPGGARATSIASHRSQRNSIQLKVAVIVTAGAAAAQIARNATSSIPIVMVDPGDPVRTKLVSSLPCRAAT